MKRKIYGLFIAMMGLALMGCSNSETAAPAAGAAQPGDYVSANIGILKSVPAGSFQRDTIATNISTVTTTFRMSRHEITRAQFAAMLAMDPSDTLYSSGTKDPVQTTTWYHAIAFCNKLSLAEGLTPVYSVAGVDFATLTYAEIPITSSATWDAVVATWANNGYRLPTDMEWVWAAMGARAGTTGYSKAFAGSTGSNAIGDYTVYDFWGTGAGRTTTERSNPVGSKLPNELGLYDMSGNVLEWCWDWYYPYYPDGALVSDAVNNLPRGLATARLSRGGSWYDPPFRQALAWHDGAYYPSMPENWQGFRVVRQ